MQGPGALLFDGVTTPYTGTIYDDLGNVQFHSSNGMVASQIVMGNGAGKASVHW
jgi:hypothetical protein